MVSIDNLVLPSAVQRWRESLKLGWLFDNFAVGKTEEVVLKKLEYIYAKQKAVEAQKKKQVEPEESAVTSTASTQQEETSAPSRELPEVAMTNRRGKPLILARKGIRATGGLKVMHVSH